MTEPDIYITVDERELATAISAMTEPDNITSMDERELAERLIVHVEKNPPLYDKNHKLDKDQRKNIWDQIGLSLGISGESAEKKWVYIKDAYRLSRKRRATIETADAAKQVKPYKYAKLLEFLTPHFQHRKTIINLPMPEEDGQTEEVQTVTTSQSQIQYKIAASGPSTLDTAIMDYLESHKQPEDDLDSFFKSVATSMRGMPAQTRSSLKFKIAQLVHKAEQSMYDEPRSSLHRPCRLRNPKKGRTLTHKRPHPPPSQKRRLPLPHQPLTLP